MALPSKIPHLILIPQFCIYNNYQPIYQYLNLFPISKFVYSLVSVSASASDPKIRYQSSSLTMQIYNIYPHLDFNSFCFYCVFSFIALSYRTWILNIADVFKRYESSWILWVWLSWCKSFAKKTEKRQHLGIKPVLSFGIKHGSKVSDIAYVSLTAKQINEKMSTKTPKTDEDKEIKDVFSLQAWMRGYVWHPAKGLRRPDLCIPPVLLWACIAGTGSRMAPASTQSPQR